MSDIQDVMQEMDVIRRTLYEGKYWQDGEAMSQVAVKLALLNSFLGEHIADAELDASNLESHYRSTREARKVELMDKEGMPATKADSQAFVDTLELRELWNKALHNHKMLQIKRGDTNNLIDTLRSRLSFMKADREKS